MPVLGRSLRICCICARVTALQLQELQASAAIVGVAHLERRLGRKTRRRAMQNSESETERRSAEMKRRCRVAAVSAEGLVVAVRAVAMVAAGVAVDLAEEATAVVRAEEARAAG
jgi:hypothetical protein